MTNNPVLHKLQTGTESNSFHHPTLLIAAAATAAPQFQTSQASVSTPRQQAAAPTFATAPSPAHPAKPRVQSAVQALQLGQAPSTHTIQQSVLPQRLVLTSQAQARLPSKCRHPDLPSRSLPPLYLFP